MTRHLARISGSVFLTAQAARMCCAFTDSIWPVVGWDQNQTGQPRLHAETCAVRQRQELAEEAAAAENFGA